MFEVMILVFVLGYIAIAMEHPFRIDKAAPALFIGAALWTIYALGADSILSLGHSTAWEKYSQNLEGGLIDENIHSFFNYELVHHLGDTAEILFFLLGAMTIVEIVDRHRGFKVITDKIVTTNKVKLLWILSLLTFFMSAILDNLTTTIVMVALLRKLVDDQKTRWFFASMIVIAANAGGAWSPIGDVTTIMLWIGGQVTAGTIIFEVFLPSLICLCVPLVILSFTMHGDIQRPLDESQDKDDWGTSPRTQKAMLVLGVGGLVFVPIFKTITHLPPYLGMLLSLSIVWAVTEIIHKNHAPAIKNKLRPTSILRRVDSPTILFFLGILLAVAALQSAGQLSLLSHALDEGFKNLTGGVFIIDVIIGVLSSVVDNVPLVAGAMGMYPIEAAGAVDYAANFVQNGPFWEFLAYTAGTGGSMLIIGSAAGVAAMGLEKIDFIWYLKNITWLAAVGYFAGAIFFMTMCLI
jgi:Na+/H+ antiporter NhaD/arsenite permease-like protein